MGPFYIFTKFADLADFLADCSTLQQESKQSIITSEV
jgi:hypothetical protein